LSTHDEPKVKLSKITSFNHYLYIVLVVNILIYTIQVDYRESIVTNILMVTCWLSLGGHAFVNEITRQVIKKSIIATPEVCFVLTRLNIILTVILISTITFCTGNTAFLFLYLIPIFQGLFSTHKRFSIILLGIGMMLLFITDVTGWLKSDYLVINKSIKYSTTFTYLTVMGVLAYLGMVLSSQITRHNHKASILHNMATTDVLTGLLNRREFNRRIAEEVARAKRHKSSVTLALFDIDFFKKINDTYGHAAGDEILRELGELITVNIRSCDIAARYGGEEFALILPETSQAEAYELLERLRIMVEQQYFYLSYNPIQATVSIGIAQYDFMDSCAADLCERADKALYQAKRNGRNRVESATLSMPKLDLAKALARQASKSDQQAKKSDQIEASSNI
jgi:diguanylate cyclase (GGDEF)-like protein